MPFAWCDSVAFLKHKTVYRERSPISCLRAGTSIGANIEEAQAGHSKADFTAKISIARKEARETLYWLKLLKAAEIIEAVN